MFRAKKFSWDGEEVKVTYAIERDGGEERHSLECADRPMPELLEALQGLEDDAIRECEVLRYEPVSIRDMYSTEDLELLSRMGSKYAKAEVRSVSWSWSKDIMGASICLLLELDHCDSPLVVNTPAKPEQPYSEGTGHTLPEKLAAKLWSLHALVERYVEGERWREQTDLFQDAPSNLDGCSVSINGGPDIPMNQPGAIRRAWAVGGKRAQA